MKTYFIFFLLIPILHYQGFGQTKEKLPTKIILQGKVADYFAKDYLYYTDGKSKINTTDRIKLGKDKSYVINLSKTKFKFAEKIYFTLDSTTNVFAQFSCFSMINYEAIRNYCKAYRLKNFVVFNDFETTFNCQTSDPPVVPEKLKELGGNYLFTKTDTTYQLFLNSEYLTSFVGKFSPADKKLHNNISGFWDFEEKSNKLILKIYLLTNTVFNTQIFTNQNWSFTVTKNNGTFSFQQIGGNGILRKIKLNDR